MDDFRRVSVRKMQESDREDVLKLALDEQQHRYVSPIWNILQIIKSRPLTTPYILEVDEKIVGYVQINADYMLTSHYCKDAHTLGLEGFFIDRNWQGKGLGVPFIKKIVEKVRSDFPSYAKVALTVNCKNVAAINTYLKGGFLDSGHLYYGGHSGPQHVMIAELNEQNSV